MEDKERPRTLITALSGLIFAGMLILILGAILKVMKFLINESSWVMITGASILFISVMIYLIIYKK